MTEVATADAEETSEQSAEPALTEGDRLFKYSEFVHVGPGADVCDGMVNGECEDPEHFHAWVRLPNPYQHREISDKARAAQARKRRQLRDSETDGNAILEAELGELRIGRTKVPIIEALIARDWAEDYLQATNDMAEIEEWSTIEHDQRRMQEIKAAPEDDRPNDEFIELGKHLEAYRKALDERVEVIRGPKRADFEAQEIDKLVDTLREQRIENIATEDFLHTFGAWEMVVGTYTTKSDPTTRKHRDRVFNHVDDLREESPEVIAALKDTFDSLRVSHQEAGTGNP